jgi:hypothetical protein
VIVAAFTLGVIVLCLQGTELNDDRTPSDATVTTTFNILVIDINDNAPEFNSSEYSVAITELAQVGFALPLFIQVVDKDEVSLPNSWLVQTHCPSWAVQPQEGYQQSPSRLLGSQL